MRRRSAGFLGACLGLALVAIGAGDVRAVPLYSVQDLGPVSSNMTFGYDQRMYVDEQGRVSSVVNGGQIVDFNAKGPLPPYDTPYLTLAQGSDNGLYTAGQARQQVGSWGSDTYEVHNGTVTILPVVPNSGTSQPLDPFGVNNSGQVVGTTLAADASGTVSSMPTIFTPGIGSKLIQMVPGTAFAINNLGQVVGDFYEPVGSPDPQTHAFFWNGSGKIEDLNSLIAAGSGWTLTMATSINDMGQIAAYGIDASGQYHALLLTPEGSTSTPTTSGGGSSVGSDSGSGSSPSDPLPTAAPEPSTLAFALVVIGAAVHRARGR